MTRRFGLRGEQWNGSMTCCQDGMARSGVIVADNRSFVEAVLNRYRTGTPWRDLPERFGDGTKVHLRFSRQARNGVWERDFNIS